MRYVATQKNACQSYGTYHHSTDYVRQLQEQPGQVLIKLTPSVARNTSPKSYTLDQIPKALNREVHLESAEAEGLEWRFPVRVQRTQ